jgi:hypothetical protein
VAFDREKKGKGEGSGVGGATGRKEEGGRARVRHVEEDGMGEGGRPGSRRRADG